jgi:hypothetical protein
MRIVSLLGILTHFTFLLPKNLTLGTAIVTFVAIKISVEKHLNPIILYLFYPIFIYEGWRQK